MNNIARLAVSTRFNDD